MPTDQELIKIVPSKRQLKYQETEFYAFFHFGMNTYTNREWGDGTEAAFLKMVTGLAFFRGMCSKCTDLAER